MKTDSATEIRKALSRFPRWTQHYFTWQTGIAEQGEQRRHPWRVRTHVAALVVSWLVTLAFGTCAVGADRKLSHF